MSDESKTTENESKTDENVTTDENTKTVEELKKENTKTLEELQKDFPSSKESSISFPGINKVNKKLSDLFDYIEKHTMEESEEKEELEKRKVEAEIEKTKAETTRAIRESEQTGQTSRFGTTSKSGGFTLLFKQYKQIEEEEKNMSITIENSKVFLQNKKEELNKIQRSVGKKKKNDIEKDSNLIKQILLTPDVTSDNLDKEHTLILNTYDDIINRIIPEKGNINWNINLTSVESKIFIEGLGLLIFYKNIIKNKEENSLIINFLNYLTFLSQDAKDLLLLHIFKIHSSDSSKIISTNVDADIIKKREEINEIRKFIIKTETEIEEKKSEIWANENNKTSIDDIIKNTRKFVRTIIVWIETTNADLLSVWPYLEDERQKPTALLKKLNETFPNAKFTEKDLNPIGYLKYKIYKKEENPLKNLYKTSISYFSTNIHSMTEKIFTPSIGIEFKFTNEFLEKIEDDYNEPIKFEEIQTLNNYIINFIKKYETKIEKIILDGKNDIIRKKGKISEEEGKKIKIQQGLKLLEEQKEKNENVQKERLKTLITALATQKLFEEESKSVIIYLKSYGYNSVEEFLNGGQKGLRSAIIERLKPFNTESTEQEGFINKQVFTESPDTEDGKNTIIKNFMALNTEIQSFIFTLIPVRTILNFSTVVKPRGEKEPRELLEKNNYEGIKKGNPKKYKNLSEGEIETKMEGINFEDYTINALNNTNIAYKQDDTSTNQTKKIEEILGKEVQPMNISTQNGFIQLGPFYKILHTSNEDVSNRTYDVQGDIIRLIDYNKDIDHITYAGYGFSGSGKTFTLIESPDSILNKIVNSLQSNNIKNIKINIYEHYKEIQDRNCNDACNFLMDQFGRKYKGNISPYLENQTRDKFGKKIISYEKTNKFIENNELAKELTDAELNELFDGEDTKKLNKYKNNLKNKGVQGIVDRVSVINKIRSKKELSGIQSEAPYFYRTSIRRTSYNDQSSRAHMFIDINFKVNGKDRKITVMDMAGSEKVQVIQDDYFKTDDGYKVDPINFKGQIEKIIKDVEKTLSNNTANKLYSTILKLTKTIPIIKPENEGTGRDEKDYHSGSFVQIIDIDRILPDKKNYSLTEKNKTEWDTLQKQIKKSKIKDYELTTDILNDFKTNYNTYQDLEKLDVISRIHTEIIKQLQTLPHQHIGTPYFNMVTGTITYYEPDGTKKGVSDPVDISKSLYSTALKDKLNKFFKDFGLSEVKNFNKLDIMLLILYHKHVLQRKTVDKNTKFNDLSQNEQRVPDGNKSFGAINVKCFKFFAGLYAKFYEQFNTIIVNLDKYVGEIPKETREFYKKNDVQPFIKQKKEWDKKIITAYHCPLRFQGNAINESIKQFKENLSKLNKNKTIGGGFPYDLKEWKTVGEKKDPKREFVVFTNVRLDFKEGDTTAIANSFADSIQFAHDILHSDKSNFGKKKVKKTSTRSFRKRGRRRGPSETEIL